MQMDIHSAQATVHEALLFSARMRLDQDISNQQVCSLAFVQSKSHHIRIQQGCNPSAHEQTFEDLFY